MKYVIGYFAVSLLVLSTSVASAQCTISWIDAAGGIFQDGTNWNTGFVPDSGDDVCITLDGTYTVEFNGLGTVNSLTLGADGNSGTQQLELTDADSLTMLSISHIDASGVLELNRGAIFPTDTLVNGGVITLTGSGPGIIKNGIVRNDSLLLLDGPAGGSLRLADGGGVDNYGLIELHSGLNILIIDNASMTDVPDTLRNQVGGRIVAIGDDPADRADITVPLKNQGGMIHAQVGFLRIHDDQIIASGILQADANASIEFYGGTKTFTGLITGTSDGVIIATSLIDLVFADTATFHIGGTGFELQSWDGSGGVVHNLGYMSMTDFSGEAVIDGIHFINDSVFAFTQGGDFDMMNGARFENYGTLRFEGNTPFFTDVGSPDSLINYPSGVIERLNGLQTDIEIPFANYGGTILLDPSSTLRFWGNSTIEDGLYDIGAGGRIAFINAASHLFSGEMFGPGDGQLDFASGVVNVPDSLILHFRGDGVRALGGMMFSGGGKIRNTGVFSTDGTFSDFMNIDSLTFVNDSVFTYVDGRILLWNQARFENAGELRVGPGLVVANGESTADSLVNMPSGSIIHTGGSISEFSPYFVNYGEIRIDDAATMRITGPTEFKDGSYYVATGGLLELGKTAVPFSFSGTHTGLVDGKVELQEASFSIPDSTTLHFAGEGIDWVSGILTGGGKLRNKGAFWFNAGSNLTIDSLVFANDSLFSWRQNRDVNFTNGAYMDNSGVIDIPLASADFLAGAGADTLINRASGEIRHSTAGNSTMNPDILNYGSINMVAGTMFIQQYFENKPGGVLEGFGELDIRFADDFVNGGIAAPGNSTGILSIEGDFDMDPTTSVLDVELNGLTVGTDYDRLSIIGNGQLGGDIHVSLGFLPTVGDMFQVVTTTVAVTQCAFPDTVFTGGIPYSAAFEVICNAADVTLEVVDVDSTLALTGSKVFLEGPFFGGAMSVDSIYAANLPLNQPFSNALYDSSPLDYDSLDTVGDLPPDVIDWLLLSLRTGTDHATEVAGSRKSAFLLSDGTIVGLSSDTTYFEDVGPGSYYLVVRGRNHMAAMSSTPVDFSTGVGQWDFTTGLGQAFGTTPMRSLPGGVFGLFTADSNFDGQATATDFNEWLADTKVAATGYLQTDFNFDGQVTATDFNAWLTNTKSAATSEVPDP